MEEDKIDAEDLEEVPSSPSDEIEAIQPSGEIEGVFEEEDPDEEKDSEEDLDKD